MEDLYIEDQFALHPSMEIQDVIKLCYQATFGAEHLLEDLEKARQYFNEEFERTKETKEPLEEYITPLICRVNFGAWKKKGLPPEQLFDIFVKSASSARGNRECFLSYVERARVLSPFPAKEWSKFVENYTEGDIRPVHHSMAYKEREKPAYRVVLTEYACAYSKLT